MMMVANQDLSGQLYKLTNWTCLYWWNITGASKKGWKLDSKPIKAVGALSVPAYNFDFLFEKMRPVMLIQEPSERAQAFDVLLKSPNPADALCELAITLAKNGLIK